MKKIIFAAMAMAAVLPAAAQDTYESARLLGEDLNGTARYVGMGGAMDALGADISTIGSNPAGIGLFRHSTASLSFGFVSQQDAQKFDGLGKTNMSFDQAGFVYSSRINRSSFVNFAFNYHKSRNFDQILNVADNALNGASLNGLTQDKYNNYLYDLQRFKDGSFMGVDQVGNRAWTYSQFDDLNVNGLDMAYVGGDDYMMDYNSGELYNFDRAHRGWINNYDFNISGNYDDRIYWGITVGLKDVKYKGFSEYMESLNRLDHDQLVKCGSVVYGDERKISGTGIDVTAGVIFRPVEESPFRVGLTIKTPTWYDLNSENSTTLLNKTDYAKYEEGDLFTVAESYDFKYYTPWKFGLSIGHTIGTNVALGAGYEFSDYGASRNRINNGYDYYGNQDSYTDELMKRNAEQSLKGVHTLKLGAELKPVPELAIRLGYNLVTAAYEQDGVRNTMLDSPGVMYSSTADYTNWKATNRITCGLGYKAGPMNIDLAYQYSATDGDFHPMQKYAGYQPNVSAVSNKRHQVLLTLGYTF